MQHRREEQHCLEDHCANSARDRDPLIERFVSLDRCTTFATAPDRLARVRRV
jgi:hypothetical protein